MREKTRTSITDIELQLHSPDGVTVEQQIERNTSLGDKS